MPEIDKIFISRTDRIGDLVLSIPSFFMLRKMYPKADIAILVRHYNYDIVKNLPYINHIFKIDDYSEAELEQKIHAFDPTVFIALYSDQKVARLARKSQAKIRIGPYSKPHSFFSYNKGLRQKRSQSVKNEAAYNLDLVRRLSPDLFDKTYEVNTQIYTEKDHENAASQFLESISPYQKLICIHPFCGGSAKNLTIDQYKSLISKLLERHSSAKVIITAIPSDGALANDYAQSTDPERVVPFINEGSILNLAALFKRVNVFVGPSTGPTHIAGAIGTLVVGIYPAKNTQSPTRWGIFGRTDVQYLIPDENYPQEDYKKLYFEAYSKEQEEKLCQIIDEFLSGVAIR